MAPPSPRVVVVDADGTARGTWAAELRSRGWDVREADDVSSALDVMIRHQPHALVTATELPGANGYQFVRTFRTVIEHDIKIAGVGAIAHGDIAGAGFDFICEVPIDFARLHEAIAVDVDPDGDRKPTTQMPRIKG